MEGTSAFSLSVGIAPIGAPCAIPWLAAAPARALGIRSTGLAPAKRGARATLRRPLFLAGTALRSPAHNWAPSGPAPPAPLGPCCQARGRKKSEAPPPDEEDDDSFDVSSLLEGIEGVGAGEESLREDLSGEVDVFGMREEPPPPPKRGRGRPRKTAADARPEPEAPPAEEAAAQDGDDLEFDLGDFEWEPLPGEIEVDLGEPRPKRDRKAAKEAYRRSQQQQKQESSPYDRCYLVGVEAKSSRSDFGIAESLEELAELARTAGLEVVGTTYQRMDHPVASSYIGSGKALEVKASLKGLDARIVIVDDELSPAQARNLEKLFGGEVRVIDRTQLILDIFAQRARTKEGKLQVLLAQHVYLKPRLTTFLTSGAGMEARGGGRAGAGGAGIGIRGAGETQLEVDRRLIDQRIQQLKRDIEEVRRHRQLYRERREQLPAPLVAIVGYTNAGKSTLLNALSGSDIFAEDKLFATLDPTTRRVRLGEGREVLVSDTVGFIQKLPTTLVAAFRATLEEVEYSDVILHVVDASNPMHAAHVRTVWEVLEDLEISEKPQLVVFNKADRLAEGEEPEIPPRSLEAGQYGHEPEPVLISAKTGQGLDLLEERLTQLLKRSLTPVEVFLPYSAGQYKALIHEQGTIKSEEYLDDVIQIKAWVPLALARKLGPYRRRPAVAAALDAALEEAGLADAELEEAEL
eukprot:tig00021135_g18940.t1